MVESDSSSSSANRPAGFPGGFTILVCVYKGDDCTLFRAALASIYANDLRPDAVQLVVDGPVPADTDAVIDEFEGGEQMRVLRLKENAGLARALNAGLARVATDWVLRADADDINLPDRFSRQARFASANPRIAVFGGAIIEVGADGEEIARREVPLTDPEVRRQARLRSPFNHMTVAFRADAVRQAGGYPQLHLREDYALWAKLLKQGCEAGNLPDVLVRATAGRDMYRRRGGWRYAKGEIELQRHLVRCGLKSRWSACAHGLVRAMIFVLPATVRGWIYEHVLRRRA